MGDLFGDRRPAAFGLATEYEAEVPRLFGRPVGQGWRVEATAALVCLLLVPVWVWITGLNTSAEWTVILCVVLGVGIGCGLAGSRRGSRVSRCVAIACLALLVTVAVGYVTLVWIHPRLYP